MSTPNCLIIRPANSKADALEAAHADLSLDFLQQTVGGSIDVAFTVPSPKGSQYAITGYVHDEGLLIDLPLCAYLVHPEGHTAPLVGPIAVVGLNWADGDTVPLTTNEIEWFIERLGIGLARNQQSGEIFPVSIIDLAAFTVESGT